MLYIYASVCVSNILYMDEYMLQVLEYWKSLLEIQTR